uniref:GPN-loop GTPase 3 n=1 Tax=Petromyzon marinus TaxID=7757 RepID=A0AAJ7SLH6_PETMA|nr:GPN-loop GTPase 3 [Petromyzon marinus]
MPRYAHLVMGPAGSGKSTYCAMMLEHLAALRRSAAVVNLDPAAEHFSYPVAVDVRDLIEVGDVTEDDSLCLGPNGGLIFCMEHLVANPSWLELALGQDEDDYLLIDCPGQVELYTHLPVMRELVAQLQHLGIRVCGVFLLDSHFMMEAFKYVSGVLTALSAMVSLEIPQVNVLSKMDLLSPGARKQIHKFLEPDLCEYLDEGSGAWASEKFKRLSKSISDLVDDYSLVRFLPLDRSEDDSVDAVLAQVDSALQYGEDEEPREPRDEDAGNDGDFDSFPQNS